MHRNVFAAVEIYQSRTRGLTLLDVYPPFAVLRVAVDRTSADDADILGIFGEDERLMHWHRIALPSAEMYVLTGLDVRRCPGYHRVSRRICVSEQHSLFRKLNRDVAFERERRGIIYARRKMQTPAGRQAVDRCLYALCIVGHTVARGSEIPDIYGAGLGQRPERYITMIGNADSVLSVRFEPEQRKNIGVRRKKRLAVEHYGVFIIAVIRAVVVKLEAAAHLAYKQCLYHLISVSFPAAIHLFLGVAEYLYQSVFHKYKQHIEPEVKQSEEYRLDTEHSLFLRMSDIGVHAHKHIYPVVRPENAVQKNSRIDDVEEYRPELSCRHHHPLVVGSLRRFKPPQEPVRQKVGDNAESDREHKHKLYALQIHSETPQEEIAYRSGEPELHKCYLEPRGYAELLFRPVPVYLGLRHLGRVLGIDKTLNGIGLELVVIRCRSVSRLGYLLFLFIGHISPVVVINIDSRHIFVALDIDRGLDLLDSF